MVSKVTHKIDLSNIDEFNELKRSAQTRVKKEVADFVREAILDHVGEGRSPVKNAPFKKSLSPDYRKQKSKVSSVTYANLELKGDMLDALESRNTAEGVEVGIFKGSLNKKKAFNHNVGDTLPARRFIPLEGEEFKQPIESGIKKIVKEYYQDKENLSVQS